MDASERWLSVTRSADRSLRCFLASLLTVLDYLFSLHPRSLIARELYGQRRPERRV